MPTKYRFVVNGDFVELYDDSYHVLTVRNTFQDIDWFYNNTSSMWFEIDGRKYYPQSPSEIEIDGVVLSAYTEFDAAIEGIFPGLAGGGGSGTEGINRAGDNLTYAADSHTFEGKQFLVTSQDVEGTSPSSRIRSVNTIGDGNSGSVEANASDTEGSFSLNADFNDGTKSATILASSTTSGSSITHTAEQHVFVGAVILPTSDPGVVGALWNNAGTPAISTGP